MKVSPEARRLAKYKKKKRIQRRDATIRRYVLYANTMRAIKVNVIHGSHGVQLNFDNGFFFINEIERDPNTTKSRPSSARHRNAISLAGQ